MCATQLYAPDEDYLEDEAEGSGSPSTSSTLCASGRTRFLTELEPLHEDGGRGASQKLLAIGARYWGSSSWWDTRAMLRLRIYDFAVYADPDSVQAAALAPPSLSAPPDSSTGCLGRRVLAQLVAPSMGSGVPPMDATLLLRAARDLPVEALGQELYDVLLRRTVKAGGSPDDPALPRLISFLSRSSIPSTMLTPAGDHVSRGGVIQFSRRSAVQQQQLAASQQQQQRAEVHGDGSAAASGLQVQQALITAALEYTPGLPTAALGGGGVNGAGVDVVGGGGVDACEIVASAGGQPLGSVSSCALSAALFDLYMGDDPVCQKAKSRAEHAVARVAADGARARYVPGKDERLVCTGRSGDGGGDQPATCVIELLH